MRRTIRSLLLAVLASILLSPSGAAAQNADEPRALRRELDALKAGQQAIQRDLAEIKALLRRAAGQTEAREISVAVKGEASKGRKDAKVTVVEFSDYQCPFCSRHVRETLPQLDRDYIATGKIKYVFRNLPLEQIHKEAFKAHEAASCAGDQAKYWPMHDRLFAHQDALGLAELPRHAQAVGLDLAAFQQCLDSGKHASKIRNDLAEALAAGINGTPTFFVGLTEADEGRVKVLRVIRGAHPFASFREVIDGLLASPR